MCLFLLIDRVLIIALHATSGGIIVGFSQSITNIGASDDNQS